MAIAEDASTPAVPRLTRVTTAALATASFTPPAGAVLLAMYALEFATAPASITTPTISGGGLTWTLGPVVQASNLTGWAGIWLSSPVPSAAATTVTVTRTELGSADAMLAVRVLTGTATPPYSGAGTSAVNTPGTGSGTQQPVTAAQAGSYIGCIGAYNSSATVWTPNASTTQFDNFADTTQGSTIASGRLTGLTSAPGAVTVGWTGPAAGNQIFAAQEVFPQALVTPQGHHRSRAALMRASLW